MKSTRFEELLLGYYEGAYGATLRLETSALADLEALRDLFRSVSTRHPVDLLSIPGVASETVERLGLTVAAKPCGLRRLKMPSNGRAHAFEWSQSEDGWLQAAELVEGLIDDGEPGHQYLTREGVDDALVELAFQE